MPDTACHMTILLQLLGIGFIGLHIELYKSQLSACDRMRGETNIVTLIYDAPKLCPLIVINSGTKNQSTMNGQLAHSKVRYDYFCLLMLWKAFQMECAM